MKIENLSRRQFLKGSVLAGGGLILGFSLPISNKALARQSGDEQAASYPVQSWLRLDGDGLLHFVVPASEMGQGSQTALAMILADEIGADYEGIRILNPGNNRVFANPMLGMQITGGSTSVRAWWKPLREVGATLRTMLITAAAGDWQAATAECIAMGGNITHLPTKRTLPFAKLVERAADLPAPPEVKLRDASEYRYIGKAMPRVDTPPKVTGQAVFGIDVQVPGMLIATIRQSPVFGGKVNTISDTATKTLPGVRAVVNLGDAVAVVADSYWQAHKGLKALEVEFSGGDTAGLDTQAIDRMLEDALGRNDQAKTVYTRLDPDHEPKPGDETLQMRYHAPYLAHTTMEPINATAHVTFERCDIWAPTQAQSLSVRKAAELTGLLPEQIHLHTTYLGGGFGRRAEVDFIAQAVQISDQVQAPVKLIWSREEDIQHDTYRPAAVSDFRITVGKDGYPTSWTNRVATSSIIYRFAPQWLGDKPDASMTEGAAETPYQLSNQHTEVVQVEPGVPVGFWRSVGNSLHGFFLESVLDELAHKAGADPLEYRAHLLRNSPRALAVLRLAADKAGWNQPLPQGRGRGIALTHSFGSYVAEVAEVTLLEGGDYRVDRVVCAADCGLLINPEIVKRQMQSGIVYGLTAVRSGKIDLADGRVVQSNFHDYPAMPMRECPAMEIHLVDSDAEPGGYGEPGTPPIAPAVANALYAAGAERVRKLPIRL